MSGGGQQKPTVINSLSSMNLCSWTKVQCPLNPPNLCWSWHCYFHFPDEKTEIQRESETCSAWISRLAVDLRFEPMFSVKGYLWPFIILPCGPPTMDTDCTLWMRAMGRKSIDLGSGKLCDLRIITTPLWRSEFSCMKWWSDRECYVFPMAHLLFFLGP